ncbi:MAG: ABC transporter ATP-binding protein [Desulfobacterota bacterium]|nr:ABC transporter ATP-binding protein [Thermodesulfobacteriota bacterium]MDW8002843.1 ABC transporter ATP-binding protein [Deltaproteobacteria bacterium]
MMEVLLKVDGIYCGYNEKLVLKGVSLEVKEGEIVGVIGPNGSGKTTFFRLLTKIITPKKGSVYFEGKDILTIPQKELAKKIAMVSQGLPQDFSMSVFDFVLLGRIPYRKGFKFFEEEVDLKIANESLELLGLSNLKDEPISKISGGERQLANIARALTQDPKVLLLDEPTAHLDIAHQIRVLTLLKKLNEKKKITEIVVFHDLNLASEFCERLILFSDGRIVRDGPPSFVLTPKNLEDVYKTSVIVEESPVSSKPYVFPVFWEMEE